ncbi:MAG: hypothetical protein CM15mV34_0250 [Caudoviricetes sp.]|nr:MAG: hypothetical protein CM15mV34_0250 [Caudoviricetes sp.]
MENYLNLFEHTFKQQNLEDDTALITNILGSNKISKLH